MSNQNNQLTVSKNLKEAYDKQYEHGINDGVSRRRILGAKSKARHIMRLCERNSLIPSKLLEVGAGDGAILYHLEQMELSDEFYGLEISRSGIDCIYERNLSKLKEAILFDGYNIPYPNEFFDLTICSHVLEHVEFPRLLLREMKRVSKHLIVEVPLDLSAKLDDKYQFFLSYGHINVFHPSILRFLLRSEGYAIVDDLTSLTSKEIMTYNRNLLFGTPSIAKQIRWFLGYRKRLLQFAIAGKARRELIADAYTVLCTKTDRAHIMHELNFG